jgi:hypothetical protein
MYTPICLIFNTVFGSHCLHLENVVCPDFVRGKFNDFEYELRRRQAFGSVSHNTLPGKMDERVGSSRQLLELRHARKSFPLFPSGPAPDHGTKSGARA